MTYNVHNTIYRTSQILVLPDVAPMKHYNVTSKTDVTYTDGCADDHGT